MAGLNKVQLIGNVVANAELRYTQSGQPVTSFRLAANERYFSGGEQRQRTEFINCVLWGKRGEGLCKAECLERGQALYVEGRIQTRSWEAQDGTKRYTTEVVVGNNDPDLQLLARRGSQVPASPEDVPPPADADADADSSSESYA